MQSGKIALEMCKYLTVFDASGNKVYENSGGAARRLAEQAEKFDGVINDAYEKSGGVARNLADKTAVLDGSLNEAYEQSGEHSRSLWERMRGNQSDWDIKNLNFDSLLIALTLGFFLSILIYYTRFN
ncbi:MAG: hypothetical protein AAGT88_03825 [Dethiobacter sp.]